MRTAVLVAAMTMLLSCGPRSDPRHPAGHETTPLTPPPPAAPVPPNAPTKPERPVLAEPNGLIDPKSVEAAGQIVQHYGALIEQRRFADAGALWGDPAAAAQFATELKPVTHMELGDLGETEGAAGSIYTTLLVTFYRTGFRRPAEIVLRRVNDVPGSTEAQRRWHIERIEWKDAR